MKCEGGPLDGLDIILNPPGECFSVSTRYPSQTNHYMKLGNVFINTIEERPYRKDIPNDPDLERQLKELGVFPK